MAENLHKAIRSMSLIDDDPILLPDEPQFRVIDEDATSLLGRLLNPECQSMQKMIEYMPTAWRVYGRVRGIALSRDRFQFIFKREEDLVTVLKDRPWSYNRWSMLLERWLPSIPRDFLSTMEVWIRIKHIPINHFTINTMDTLASKVGHVEEIAYDSQVSQVQDYIRARVTINVENPAIPAKNLILPSGEIVVIEFEYEKVYKRCFHCHRLTHEKLMCPWLHRNKSKLTHPPVSSPLDKATGELSKTSDTPKLLDAPPGFPPLFPELPQQEQNMALQYISHPNEAERNARILRVRQSIEESKTSLSVNLLKITNVLDKGKGHVYDYNTMSRRLQWPSPHGDKQSFSEPVPDYNSETGAQNSPSQSLSSSLHFKGSTGFNLGAVQSSGAGTFVSSKKSRKRPPSWKRKIRSSISLIQRPSSSSTSGHSGTRELSCKRKAVDLQRPIYNKESKITNTPVASVLKPLPPQ